MRKRILNIMLCCVMLVGGVMPTTAFAEVSTAPADITGAGTTEDPYQISTAEDLKTFRDIVNGQNGKTQNTSACAVLMNDIVLNDGTFEEDGSWSKEGTPETWTPIGAFNSDKDYSANRPYTGTFDGGGYTIKGIYAKNNAKAVGLFGCTSGATIKNVAVTGYMMGKEITGGIVGCVDSSTTITNCINHATIVGRPYSGGIIGRCWNINGQTNQPITLTGCFNTGELGVGTVGGLVGGSEVTIHITDCGNIGDMWVSADCGGIIGVVGGTVEITNCYSAGKTTKQDQNASLGALVGGMLDGATSAVVNITNSYWLSGTAENAIGESKVGDTLNNTEAKSETEFANGLVLNLLKGDRDDSPWGSCGYLEAAGMIVPLPKGQKADSVDIIGAGTAEDPYYICTATGLKDFRSKVNAPSGAESGAHAVLMNDIDLNNEPWTPIANYTGTFDGNGKAIKGLYVKDVENAGLFASLSGGAVVKNLTVEGNIEASKTNGNAYAGGIAAQISGSAQITGCVNNATVKAMVNNGTENEYIAYAGGMAGHASGSVKITSCTNNGAVVTDSTSVHTNTGGMAGYAESGATIENCLNTADLSAAVCANTKVAMVARAGGTVGQAYNTTITGCYNTGDVTATITGSNPFQSHAGGIIGSVVSTSGTHAITNCGNTGSITSTGASNGNYAGGIMSDAATTLTDSTTTSILTVSGCYSTGTITAKNPIVAGGIAGILINLKGTLTVSHCYLLTSSCDTGVGEIAQNKEGIVTDTADKTKAEFADGTVLNLLKEGSIDTSWGSTGYLNVAGMTLPLLSWQKADTHGHDFKLNYDETNHWKECDCGLIESGSKVAHTTEWIQTSTTHMQKCTSCGAIIVDEVSHQWKNGVCKDCGYTKPYSPTVQKPEITVIGSGKVTLSAYGSIANITADEGYELVSITLNGKEIANTDKLTGLKTGDKVVVTFQKKSEQPTVDTKTIADKVSKMQMTARSSKTTKKNIRITVKTDKETNNLIKEIKDLGYTVKYKYYRSTKKSSQYKARIEKDASINSFINTVGKKGTKYYYKVRVMVYDADGSLVAKSDLKQCKYAARTWSK